MISTVALEARIEQGLAQWLEEVAEHPQVETLFKEFHDMVKSQRETLEARLRTVVSNVPDFDNSTTVAPISEAGPGSEYPVSAALQNLYTMFSRVIMAYTTLQPLTLRFRDSWVASEENTAIIVKEHTSNYAAALQKINQLIHDVVVWEMDQEGLECTCACASCSLGVCLCATASRTLLGHAWDEAGPIVVDKGITVLPPRSESAALKAGLRGGDIILAADGHELDKWADIFDPIQTHESGESIEFHVHRESGEVVDIAVEIP
jgi:hypothetical protein